MNVRIIKRERKVGKSQIMQRIIRGIDIDIYEIIRNSTNNIFKLCKEIQKKENQKFHFFYTYVLRKIFWRRLPGDVISYLFTFFPSNYYHSSKVKFFVLSDVFILKYDNKLTYELENRNFNKRKTKLLKRKPLKKRKWII